MNDAIEVKLPDELVQLVSKIESNVDQSESLIFEKDGNLKKCIAKPNNLAAFAHLLLMLSSDQRKELIGMCDISYIHSHFFGLEEIYWFHEKYPMLFDVLLLLEHLRDKLKNISINMDKIIMLPMLIPFLSNKKCSFMISDNDVLAYLLAFPHHANDILLNEKLFYRKLSHTKAVSILKKYFPSISSDELPVCSTLSSDYNDAQNKDPLVELRHIILLIARHASKSLIPSTEMMKVSEELLCLDDDNKLEYFFYDGIYNSVSINDVLFAANEENPVFRTTITYYESGHINSKEEHSFDREELSTCVIDAMGPLVSSNTKTTNRRNPLDRALMSQNIGFCRVFSDSNIFVFDFNIHTLAVFTFLPDCETKAATTLSYFQKILKSERCDQSRNLFVFIDNFSTNYVFPFTKFDIDEVKGFIHSLERYKIPISHLYLGYLFMRSAEYHSVACDVPSETIEIILMDMLRNLSAAMKDQNSDFQRCVREMLTHVSIVYGEKYRSVNRCMSKIQYLMGENISINEFLYSDGFSKGFFKPIQSCQLKLSIPITPSLTNASNTKPNPLEFWKGANLEQKGNAGSENHINTNINGLSKP